MMASNLHVLLFGVLCVASIIKVIYCQDACERITSDNLGRSDMLGNTGLVATILNPVGKDVNAVDVRILNMTIVCEAQHRMQDRYRYTSVVVSFNCQQQTVKFNVSECANMSVVYTEQYDFGCIDGTWSPNTFTVSTAARTANPTATLSTGLNTSCIACINPSNPEAENLAFVDNITHCLGCDRCLMGLQRCHGNISVQICCNYFLNRSCVEQCPENFAPNNQFDCEMMSPSCGQDCIVGIAVGIGVPLLILTIIIIIIIAVCAAKKCKKKN